MRAGSLTTGLPSPGPHGADRFMDKPCPASGCARWQPEFAGLLNAVESSGAHGPFVDVRKALRGRVGAGRPLVMLCPHADDGAITAACLMHQYAVKLGLP